MAKAVLRRITIEGQLFLWSRTHRHRTTGSEKRCVERLRAFAEGNKRVALEIAFGERPGWQVGYPSDGVVWSTTDSKVYNLNRPAVVRALILYALRSGWMPNSSGKPVCIEDGISLLALSGAPTGDA